MKFSRKPERRKQHWDVGSIFSVEQSDGLFCLGQVVDMPLPNAPSCVFYDIRFPARTELKSIYLPEEKIIAAVSTTRELLDRGKWRVLACEAPALERRYWPNEYLRELGWVGAETHGAGIVTRFLEAYYGFAPWDYYADPTYFDKLLFPKAARPKRLLFKKV